VSTVNGNLSGGQELAAIIQSQTGATAGPRLGSLIKRIIQSVNTTAKNASVSPTGQLAAPPPPDSVNVVAGGGLAHVQITHNASVNKGINYFTEADTNPNFTQPHVIDHGASRSSHPFPLPAFDSSGKAQSWHFRSYAQYPGSLPSKPTTFGGANGATPVSVGGSVNLTMLPSTGSGTASPTGGQGGHGFGVVATRPAPGPKRSAG
jgi:hypothetical protein